MPCSFPGEEGAVTFITQAAKRWHKAGPRFLQGLQRNQ